MLNIRRIDLYINVSNGFLWHFKLKDWIIFFYLLGICFVAFFVVAHCEGVEGFWKISMFNKEYPILIKQILTFQFLSWQGINAKRHLLDIPVCPTFCIEVVPFSCITAYAPRISHHKHFMKSLAWVVLENKGLHQMKCVALCKSVVV